MKNLLFSIVDGNGVVAFWSDSIRFEYILKLCIAHADELMNAWLDGSLEETTHVSTSTDQQRENEIQLMSLVKATNTMVNTWYNH